MSTKNATLDDDSPVHPGEEHTHGPTDGQYFIVFWVLVVLTALEVSTEWWPDDVRPVAVAVLMVLMAIKFFLVAAVFMHLRYDPALLKRVFYFAMLVAIIVYGAALTSLNFWTDSGMPWFNDPPPVPPTTVVVD